MNLRKMQIPLIAVAAFAMFAMAAALLLAGDAQAHATTTTLAADGGDNTIPQQQGQAATPTPPRHATPEACPGEPGNSNDKVASVVDRGQYALFDVWWNDDEGELTNTVCPPSVVHVPGNEKEETPASDTRSPSSINITAEPPTIIHIPSSAKVTLTESAYPKDKYREVWQADDDENPNGDGDRNVWVLPACPTDGSTFNGLCISFSAALLNSADWDGNIEFIVTHVHQTDIDKQDRRYVLAYDVPATGDPVLRWNSADQDTDKVYVAAGGYDRPLWLFPTRGAYEFQVYIRGEPDTTITDPVSKDHAVTSDFRFYILHVGAEANLGVGMTVAPDLVAPDTTLDPGDNVSIEITASNAGPDTAPSTKVEVALPEGLTYSSHTPATDTFTYDVDEGVWIWDARNLASGASKTLDITATVDAETHGQALTAKATISATETVTTNSGDHDVPVPDPNSENNMATGTTTVARMPNVNPMFMVARSVPEGSPAGTNVGAPVLVKDTEDILNLTFTLSGDGHRNFRTSHADGGVHIKVAADAYLNYEDTTAPYNLMLHVSDGKDSNGNDDNDRVDDTIPVRIAVTDVAESVGVTLTPPSTATAGQYIWLRGTLGDNPPATRGNMTFIWFERSPNGEAQWLGNSGSDLALNFTNNSAGVKEYAVIGKYIDTSAGVIRTVESAWVQVTWTNP